MIRFIFVCMGLVALSILTVAGNFMLDGIKTARMGVQARNNAATTDMTAQAQPSGPTFEEIYANAPAQNTSPDSLNAIESAAGGKDNGGFGQGFTNTAPKALEDQPAQIPAEPQSQGAEPAAN